MTMTQLSALAMALTFCGVSAAGDPAVLQANGSHRWLKGNMHTHSLWSDGDDFPEMIARWYLRHDYQFVVFTDHNTLLRGERWIDAVDNKGGAEAFQKLQDAGFPQGWITTREAGDGRTEVRLKTFDEIFDQLAVPEEFLLIQGEEVSDRFGRLPVHLCATNTSSLLTPLGGDSVVEVMQRNVDAAVSHRARTGEATLIHLNHPNFYYAVTAEQLMQVVGERFFEVYNGHPAVRNTGDQLHASTDRMWDIINTWRLARLNLPLMYGLATDDSHSYHTSTSVKDSQPGRGWVMVLSDALTPDALVESLEAGHFYSSTGVALESVVRDDEEFTVAVDDQPDVTYTIDFIGTRTGFDDASAPSSGSEEESDLMTRQYSEDVGRVLKSVTGSTATYRFVGDEIYVRALVTSSRPHPNPGETGEMERAWIQPVQP